MTWTDVYREHWTQIVSWCRRVYGPAIDAENVAQAAFTAVWRNNRGAVLGWSPELTTWHLIRESRMYVSRRPAQHRVSRPIPGDVFPDRPACLSVAEYLPDHFPADERAVLLAACDEGRTLRDIEGTGGKLAAERLWRRAVRRLQSSPRLAGDFHRAFAALS